MDICFSAGGTADVFGWETGHDDEEDQTGKQKEKRQAAGEDAEDQAIVALVAGDGIGEAADGSGDHQCQKPDGNSGFIHEG